MKKISNGRHLRHGKPRSTSTSHYERMEREAAGGHPIDLVVDKQVRQRTAGRRLIGLQKKLLERLGDDKRPFFELEALHMRLSAERQRAYFDVGYEHGLADALATERRGRITLPAEAAQLATECRERIVQAQLPVRDAMLGILECLWAVAATPTQDSQ